MNRTQNCPWQQHQYPQQPCPTARNDEFIKVTKCELLLKSSHTAQEQPYCTRTLHHAGCWCSPARQSPTRYRLPVTSTCSCRCGAAAVAACNQASTSAMQLSTAALLVDSSCCPTPAAQHNTAQTRPWQLLIFACFLVYCRVRCKQLVHCDSLSLQKYSACT